MMLRDMGPLKDVSGIRETVDCFLWSEFTRPNGYWTTRGDRGNSLTIRVEIRDKGKIDQRNYIVREHNYGTFSWSVTLPRGLKTDEIDATCDEGVPILTIPRGRDVKSKVIKGEVKQSYLGNKVA